MSTTGHVTDPAGINHPHQYNNHPSGVEAVEICRHMNFNLGSAFKYVLRRGEKVEAGMERGEAVLKDLKKALWYVKDHNTYLGRPAQPMPASVQEVARHLILCEPNAQVGALYQALIMGDAGSQVSAMRAEQILQGFVDAGGV